MADSNAFRGWTYGRPRPRRRRDRSISAPANISIPTTFTELFGLNDATRWGHMYARDDEGPMALWTNEALASGWDAEHWTPANIDNQPEVGTLNGNTFPWFAGVESSTDGDTLKTADNFDVVDG